ncbi:response regulator [Aquabacterium fontiphilum]|uniref:hybrid sensor histidine kinase/response regulator n=1 Tax=Aquabacterium fontiphilum TaxID=450365 RepID=UPI001377DE31|nr:ATP-binding protein [Aquabacterium fontiphilum]NBD20232.1 response regulator [Aquabacterium fontiphilum]
MGTLFTPLPWTRRPELRAPTCKRPRSSLWALLLSIWLTALGWMALTGSAQAEPAILQPSAVVVRQATLAPGACSEHQPGRVVMLPDDWRGLGMTVPGVACYRAKVYMERSPVIPWGLRIDRLPGNHRVTINGIQMSTRHMEGEVITSMATLPYLIELPVNVLLAGENDIEIDVRMNPFRKPGIGELQIGPLTEARQAYDQWVALTVDLPRIMNLSVAGMALFIVLAWRTRPHDRIFAYFGGLMLVMCGRNAFYFVETITWPAPVVDWLFFACQAVGTYYLSLFGLTYAQMSLERLRWPLRFIGFGLPLLALMAMGTPHLDTLRLLAYPLMMGCGVLVVIKVVQTAWRKHWIESVAMTLGPVGTLVSVAHDYLFLTPLLPVTDLYWTPYTAPVIFLGFALTLMGKFVEAMNMAERMNHILEERVADRTRALEAANQSKTRFLAAASHDLRQPTAAIGLLVSLLRQQTKAPESKDLINMLDEAVASMESLLVGLLDISRLDAGAVKPEFQSVSLHDVFQAVRVHEQSAAQAKGLRLRFRLPRTPAGQHPVLLTDPMLLHSVLRNLVSNAIRYTQRGGVLVAARRRGKHRIRIEVWDTGIGIPDDQRDRIFEEFYQVGNSARDRTKGIGLGLAIVRRMASILGERIELRSRPGRGSCFAIELPLNLAATTATTTTETRDLPLQGRSVWLVEDDLLLRRALTEMLRNWGAEVRAWPDAESLLDELPQLTLIPADALPDAVITDYRLPGMSGVQLMQHLHVQWRAKGRQLDAVVISGDTDPAELQRLSASGLTVLPKPFRSERLLEQLLQAPPEARAA